jgi:transmembrane sensor
MDTAHIINYLSGECDPEQKKAIEFWINLSAENNREFQRIQTIWSASAISEKNFNPDVDLAWQKVQAVLIQHQQSFSQINQGNKTKVSSSQWFTFIRVAALIVLGISISILLFVVYKPTPAFLAEDINLILVTTHAGEKTEITLPDETKVWLNENSQLQYPENFEASERNVKLTGEGYFEVKNAPNHPFIIESPHSFTKVLGTSFFINAYPQQNQESITLLSGEVSFGAKNEVLSTPVILKKGQKAVLDLENNNLRVDSTYNPNQIAWKTGILVFENTPLEEVISTFSQYYQKKIEVKNKALLSCHLTSTFNNKSLIEALEVLSLTLDIQYAINNNLIHLEGKGCE